MVVRSSTAFTRERLAADFATFKHACPNGVYVAPLPDKPLTWSGALFPRKGPYAKAVLRFHVDFPACYPLAPPVITFSSELFHPLVTPSTTHTYTTRIHNNETMSAANDRLPAGGFALRHGFPEWFDERSPSTDGPLVSGGRESPHIVEVLQYLRIVFETETVLDSVPLELAANAGAWHAWQSYRSKILDGGLSEGTRSQTDSLDRPIERSLSPGQQPGGARRPGEWNWQGVWEDRVQKSIQASSSEPVLYGGDGQDVINFLKMDQETFGKINLGEYTGM